MKINFSSCSEEELWKYVATHLKKKGIDTVLVGGSVVSIYSDGIYKSGDLDFVLVSMFQKGVREAMEEIGFVQKGSRHYIHSDCKHLFIEFPSGFLEIGDDSDIVPDEVQSDEVKIKILSPTDCVKDRLASYIYFHARECLDQAVLVAKKHPVNFESIKKWCVAESATKQWDEFLAKIKS